MNIDKISQLIIGTDDEKKAEGFLRFLSKKLWGLYNEYIMDKVKMAENEIKWNLNIPNAKENQEYTLTVEMPKLESKALPGVEIQLEEVKGLDEDTHGLHLAIAQDRKSFSITGTPSLEAFRKEGATAESTYELTLTYSFKGLDMPESKPVLEKRIPFIINQDPRKLWKNLPVNWDNMPEPKYRKNDTETAYVKVEALPDGTPQKDIVAASKRGRDHAQKATPRDDHFRMEYMDNGWYIMAVADGAGSAKFSREGSRIACYKSVETCLAKLGQCKPFEEAIAKYVEYKKEGNEKDARKEVGDFIYNIIGTAAFEAHKAINSEAATKNKEPNRYATTLLLSICKKFSFGWFVASFWVGDGAICLYDRKAHTAKILGVPDEGSFGGETRFLTMPEIFKDTTALFNRLRFCIVEDFTALFLMTDGVSDPKFETDANLNNPDKWDDLWDDLKENGVELIDNNENAQNQLLDWLDFWSSGNHDDRTIAILYEGEAPMKKDGVSDTNEADAPKSDLEDTTIPQSEDAEATAAESHSVLPPVEDNIEISNDEIKG